MSGTGHAKAGVAGLGLAGALLCAAPASALTLAECERTTHISHGGEADHMDHGDGWVSWTGWWEQEGSYAELHVAQCRDHRLAVSRLKEERIADRTFDRRRAGGEVFERHMRRSTPLRAIDELAEQLTAAGGETRLGPLLDEPCACAAAYPGARGDLPPFELN
ncbi:hypothetical protein [Jannaschia marina]|uniref:hypothetical protein n=1 Tax=Jannaschia marina TaxID=2741674 RepID=UPI0015CB276B|nr:hypothetical protein [Jannaschia marina]